MANPRPRERVIENLESVYREAFERARAAEDQGRMADLDASFQREQLLLEVLLDIRDAIHAIGDSSSAEGALDKLKKLRDLTRLR